MAASSPLPLQLFSSRTLTKKPTYQKPSKSIITATISEKSNVSPAVAPSPSKLPIREVPGDYGLPLIGPWRDRQDFFYNQGQDEYFISRIQKYQSTVFKTNMPPGPFISSNSNVIVLLDGKSFPALFDTDKVEKKDLFTGTYMPSVDLTGGYRVLSYLDPSEPNHTKLKKLMFFMISNSRNRVFPEFNKCYSDQFDSLEKVIASSGRADFGPANDQAAFNFLARSFLEVDPANTKLGSDGPDLVAKWVLFQLHPLLSLGLPWLLDDLLHTFALPAFLVQGDYQRLYEFFNENSAALLNEAEQLGLSRDEACHNLLYTTCFNSFGGMKILFPSIVKWVGQGGKKLHLELATEIREAIKSSGGSLTMAAMEKMPLMKSVVYEALRVEPPVPSQYAKAKKDFVIESHDAAFQIKAGDMMYGLQPFATKDPKIFDRPEEFVPDRFVGEEGEKLLKHVLWSNGPETEDSTLDNKQCAGKDFVVMVARLLVVELFRRYDSFDIELVASPLGASVFLTSLNRASF